MKTTQGSNVVRPIFIGRWAPKILLSLKERPYRRGKLRRNLGSVSQRMLTRNLRNLESTGLVTRRVTRSKTIAIAYSLTRLGRTLSAPLRGVCRWAKQHRRNLGAEAYVPNKRPGQDEALEARPMRRRSTRAAATSGCGATAGAAVGFRSRRSTDSRPIKEAPRWRTFSGDARSSLSTLHVGARLHSRLPLLLGERGRVQRHCRPSGQP